MSRIPKLFSKKTEKIIPFLTSGYPEKSHTIDLVLAAEESGATMIELGMPFSDPLADGPVIQQSSEVAIKNGVDIKWILKTIEEIRRLSEIPLVLMGYINPIIRYGLERFMDDCRNSGVDGLIVPDLPLEEADEFVRLSRLHEISPILLVAPNTSPKRIKIISELAKDLIYCVAILGVTGSSENSMVDLVSYLRRVKKNSSCPFIVGFGVKTRQDVKLINELSNGAVAGSAIINAIDASESPVDAVKEYIESLLI